MTRRMLFVVLLFGIFWMAVAPATIAQAQGADQVVAEVEEDEEGERRTLTDWYLMGGWIMHALVGTSLVIPIHNISPPFR